MLEARSYFAIITNTNANDAWLMLWSDTNQGAGTMERGHYIGSIKSDTSRWAVDEVVAQYGNASATLSRTTVRNDFSDTGGSRGS